MKASWLKLWNLFFKKEINSVRVRYPFPPDLTLNERELLDYIQRGSSRIINPSRVRLKIEWIDSAFANCQDFELS
jgi:hypothetical protein